MPTLSKFGDWARAGVILQGFSDNVVPNFEAQLTEDGELILNKIREHIEAQDLNWTPLSKHTVQLKHGSETIYVESGFLRDNLSVRKVKTSKGKFTIFVGASPWKTTPDGKKLSDLMIWLEYGTNTIPPRPLIRPTWKEVEPIIKEHWKETLMTLIGGD